jgi:hypothetical protein
MGVMTSSTQPRETTQPGHPRAAFLGLTTPQVAGGALASVTAALAASRLGVGGTLIGAAFGSVISTIGGALYAHSLDRAGQRVITTRQRLIRPAVGSDLSDPVALPPELDQRTGVLAEGPWTEVPTDPSTESAIEPRAPQGREPARGQRRGTGPRRPGWPVLLAAAVAFFVIGMGVITGLEFLLGHPVSGSGTSGTTVERVVVREPVAEPSPTPSGAADSSTPSATPSPVEGTTDPASAQATPTSSPAETLPTPSVVDLPPAPTADLPGASPAPAAS